MASSKHIDTICIVIVVLALILTVLFMNGEALGIRKIVDEDAETYSGSAYFTANDLNADWDTSAATVITLEGGDGKVSGNGAYFYDGGLVISNAGWYVLSGTLTDGSITVDAYSSSKIWLLLDGVTVNCSDDACLRIDQADKVFLTLAEGSENSFTSGAEYSEDALEDGTGGTIFAHDDLTINGSGRLSITANYKHGIDANDALVITGGVIDIACPQDGLHVNDEINLCGASLTISAGDDGIHSDTSFYIESGTILIEECYEGIEAPVIDIAGGDITLYPSDDGLNANGGSGDMFGGMGGFSGGKPGMSGSDGETPDFSVSDGEMSQLPESTNADSGDEDEEESYIRISGGTLTIINETAQDADGIDSNGSIYITGGTIRVSMANSGGYALDVGSESGGVMEISGGSIVGCGSYSMAESFDSTSTQPSILYTYSAGAEAGATVALEDTDGNVIISYTPPCSFSCVNLSCEEMEVGETYLMVIGDNVEEITLEEVSASYGDAQSGGFGGTMNFGGMQSRDDFMGHGGGMGGGHMRGGRGGEDASGGEMPEPPDFGDFDGEMPEPPDFGGETPDMGGGFPGMADSADAAVAGTEETSAGYSADVWIWSGVSLAALVLGLAVALIYKRRRI